MWTYKSCVRIFQAEKMNEKTTMTIIWTNRNELLDDPIQA